MEFTTVTSIAERLKCGRHERFPNAPDPRAGSYVTVPGLSHQANVGVCAQLLTED